jgi:hypothetical protein
MFRVVFSGGGYNKVTYVKFIPGPKITQIGVKNAKIYV